MDCIACLSSVPDFVPVWSVPALVAAGRAGPLPRLLRAVGGQRVERGVARVLAELAGSHGGQVAASRLPRPAAACLRKPTLTSISRHGRVEVKSKQLR